MLLTLFTCKTGGQLVDHAMVQPHFSVVLCVLFALRRRMSLQLLSCCSLVRRRCYLLVGVVGVATTPSRRGSTQHPR
jgi:hypothetical protein